MRGVGRFGSAILILSRLAALPIGAIPSALIAQTSAFQLGAVYQCSAGQSFKVLSCSGSQNADLCDVQSYNGGQPNQRGKSTHQQVMALVRLCHLQTPAEARAEARGGSADPNGFKIGDTVQVNTGFGWIEGRVLAMNGNDYRVRVQTGTEVTKTYPSELRRIGPLTTRDKAAGVYNLHDRVQVNVEGRWVDGEIITTMGMDYQVQLPGHRTAWANSQNLRHVASEKPAAPQSGVPPKPGLTSCAGKIEGRYATTGGFGSMTIVFRSGKAIMKDAVGGDDVNLECWMGGDKIYLHKPGDSANQDMPIDINNDGTLQTPFGEIKKKGN